MVSIVICEKQKKNSKDMVTINSLMKAAKFIYREVNNSQEAQYLQVPLLRARPSTRHVSFKIILPPPLGLC